MDDRASRMTQLLQSDGTAIGFKQGEHVRKCIKDIERALFLFSTQRPGWWGYSWHERDVALVASMCGFDVLVDRMDRAERRQLRLLMDDWIAVLVARKIEIPTVIYETRDYLRESSGD